MGEKCQYLYYGRKLVHYYKILGVDPEVGAYGSRDITLDTSTGGNYSGNANVIYPVPRRISLGFNFSF